MDNKADLSAIIEKLMSDPSAVEMVQKLKQGTLSDSVETNSEKDDTAAPSKSENPPDTAKLLSSLTPLLNGLKGGADTDSPEIKRRNQLLCALKPYLSRERQEMIDMLTSLSRVSGIWDILSGAGKNENGK